MSTEDTPNTDSTPQTPEKSDGPILREHVYDGIQEYDQKLPNWWLFTLYGAIVYFIAYWVLHYHVGVMKTREERLDPIIAELREKRTQEMLAMLDDPNLWKMSRDASYVREGQQVYQQICLPCHAPNLGGNTEYPPGMEPPSDLPPDAPKPTSPYIGRSLIDDEWTHGGTPTEIYKMIYDGTPDPAAAVATGQMVMPPQGITLGADKVAKVTAFVLSHHSMPEGGAETPAPEKDSSN